MTFGTGFPGTPCIFLLVLTIIPIVALLKTKKSIVDGQGVGRPAAVRAMQFRIDATTGHPAGLGPWLPYSESKPAARARGGHPLASSPRPSGSPIF